MIFYHGTSTTRLADILETGLVPQATHDNPGRCCLYLTTDPSIAELYADLASTRRGGKPVVVEIDDRHLPAISFEPDDYELQNHIYDLHDKDRSDSIGILTGDEVDERLRPYRRWQDVPVGLCLAVTNQVAFSAPIPVSAIRNAEQLSHLDISSAQTPHRAGAFPSPLFS
jgi:hypothetical protein